MALRGLVANDGMIWIPEIKYNTKENKISSYEE